MAPRIVFGWIGKNSGEATIVVIGLMAAFLINLGTGAQTIAANAINKPELVAYLAGLVAALSCATVIPLTSSLGIVGAILGIGAALAAGAVVETLLVTSEFVGSRRRIIADSFLPVSIAALVALPFLIASNQIVPGSRIISLLTGGTGAVLFAVIFLSVCALFRGDVRAAILTVYRKSKQITPIRRTRKVT